MQKAIVNFEIYNNERWQDSLPLRYLTGEMFNFGEFDEVHLQVKRDPFHSHPQIDADLTSGLSVETDGALSIDIDIVGAEGESLYGAYVHEIAGILDGERIVVAVGTVNVKQGVNI